MSCLLNYSVTIFFPNSQTFIIKTFDYIFYLKTKTKCFAENFVQAALVIRGFAIRSFDLRGFNLEYS
jgi:hypothetical protein